ncbi:MAG TPA: transglycosylase SLT domain-containing protein [Acidobacteriota bacterium]|nr:transglycosylase SLT domain-containing protein [Acidobacteriota bacterium]
MNHRKFFLLAILLMMTAGSFCASAWGQQPLYSYTDDNGIQVYTNLPPVNSKAGMKIQGSVPPAEPPPPIAKEESYNAIIEKYAGDYGLDPSLIHSIIATESGFNSKAVSPKGARGLMQLMPATAQRLGVSNSFDPEENIRGGVKHFRSLMDNFNNDLELSLAAYNAGENLVQRLGRVPEIRETKDYVQSVTTKYGKKTAQTQEQEGEKHPPAFRFIDESGILHLTNIPPSR